jgi:hypothetical protein
MFDGVFVQGGEVGVMTLPNDGNAAVVHGCGVKVEYFALLIVGILIANLQR